MVCSYMAESIPDEQIKRIHMRTEDQLDGQEQDTVIYKGIKKKIDGKLET